MNLIKLPYHLPMTMYCSFYLRNLDVEFVLFGTIKSESDFHGCGQHSGTSLVTRHISVMMEVDVEVLTRVDPAQVPNVDTGVVHVHTGDGHLVTVTALSRDAIFTCRTIHKTPRIHLLLCHIKIQSFNLR